MPLLFNTPPLNVYEQMALDETLVRMRAGEITLRLYHWITGAAATFGYAQNVAQVRRGAQERAFGGSLCRRPTGGGLVYHEDDLTFSLIFPSQDKPSEIYRQLHAAVQAALVLSGVRTTVFAQKTSPAAYAPSQQNQASACFTNPVENDLLRADGQKMLGGAIRRFGNTVLYQGSLQLPQARENAVYKQAIINAVRGFLNVDLKIEPLAISALEQAKQLARTQYQSAAWLEKF